MKGMRSVLVAGMALAVAAGGCAKKDLVKSEEQPRVETALRSDMEPASPPAEERMREAAVTTMEPQGEEPSRQEARQPGEGEALPQAVYFDFDSHLLREDAREALARNAELLKKAQIRFVVEGHCDERGSDEYNLALGDRRAEAVRDYLVILGVPEEKIETVSYGKELPVDQGHDENAWSKNRRGEFIPGRE